MASTVYGFNVGDYKALYDFRPRKNDKGEVTAYQGFNMLRGTWEGGVKQQFSKGASIVTIAPHIDSSWAYLKLETWEISGQPGGYVTVTAEFKGFDEDDESEEEVSYSLSATLIEAPITEHPLFKKEVIENAQADSENKTNLVAAINEGLWRLDGKAPIEEDEITFIYVPDGATSDWILTDEDAVKWARVVFEQGVRTFKTPTLTWTMERVNLGGLVDDDIERLGLMQFQGQQRPPGNPPQPFHGFREWMLISANDHISTTGTSNNTLTWELSPAGGFHRFLGEAKQGGKGIYNYDPSEL